MSEQRELKWGTTPWDDMPREELLRHVQRLYSAAISARCALRLSAHGDRSGFWGKRGTGGNAIAKCEHAMREAAPDFFEEEGDLYSGFFRYAADLLFPGVSGFGWRICECGQMFAADPEGRPCAECLFCKKPTRPITWADLKPIEKIEPQEDEARTEERKLWMQCVVDRDGISEEQRAAFARLGVDLDSL